MHTMKAAISVDDTLIDQAGKAAAEIGVSRSKLFSIAMADFLKKRRDDEITEQLNRAYANEPTDELGRVLAGMKGKFRNTVRDRW
jgi:metal-responsive CopG/Arc/MetJ family transcriptional regulator